MRVTMAIFPIGPDFISVLAFGTEGQKGIWKRHYSTLDEVIDGLQQTGMVSEVEADELRTDLDLVGGFPFFKGAVEGDDLENAGFFRVISARAN